MRFYPIRIIMSSQVQTVYGVTIPPHLFDKWSGTKFTIESVPEGILLRSGCEAAIKERRERMANSLYAY